MKTNNTFKAIFFSLIFSFSLNICAQLDLPRGSQHASVSQLIGISDITVYYSRPSVNGREIWGKLVPYGMNNLGFGTAKESPWRAGANENTIIKFTHDATIEGQPIKSGTYGFHIIVHEDDTATLIFSKDYDAWGSFFYKPENDVIRVDITTESTPFTELLTFSFDKVTAQSAILSLSWEKKKFPLKIEVNVPQIVMNSIRSDFKGQNGFLRQNWEQAANYALNNGGDLEEALTWIDSAIKGQFFSKRTFNNLQIKAQILEKMNKPEEAIAIMDEALKLATVFEVHQYGRTLITQGKKDKALEVFQMNAKNNKNIWPVHYGLARGYSALGDYNKALSHLEMALKNAPNEASKGRVQANIEKLRSGTDIN